MTPEQLRALAAMWEQLRRMRSAEAARLKRWAEVDRINGEKNPFTAREGHNEERSMTVRAKVRCQSKRDYNNGGSPGVDGTEVSLTPVYGDGKANESWSKYTPSGEIRLTITNPAAVAAFEVGKEYFVDFTPAE